MTTGVQFQTPRILWAALFMSTVTFIGVLVMLHRQHEIEGPPSRFVFYALGMGAIAVAGASATVPRMLLGQAVAKMTFDVKQGMVENPADALRRVIVPYQTSFIVGMALADAVTLAGFMLGYLGAPLEEVAPFFLVGWLLMAFQFPREATLVRAIEEQTSAVMR